MHSSKENVFLFHLCTLNFSTDSQLWIKQAIFCITNVVNRHRFHADPAPDPTFHFDANPDPNPDTTQSLTNVGV